MKNLHTIHRTPTDDHMTMARAILAIDERFEFMIDDTDRLNYRIRYTTSSANNWSRLPDDLNPHYLSGPVRRQTEARTRARFVTTP